MKIKTHYLNRVIKNLDGTFSPMTLEEMYPFVNKPISNTNTKMFNKILNISDLNKKFYKKIKKKVVLCHGVFDMLHIGHLNHFEEFKIWRSFNCFNYVLIKVR